MRIRSHRSRGVLAVAALAAALAVSAIAASSASAVLVKLPNGQIASYQPLRNHHKSQQLQKFDTTFQNMDYNGGAVMPSNTDYMVVWSPKGLSPFPSEYVPGIAEYFKNLAHDSGGHQNVDSVATQYGDLSGAFAKYQVTFGGVFIDTDPYPASKCPVISPVTNCLTDSQLQAELQKFVAARGLKHDLTHEAFVFTPPHVESCFTDQASASFGGCTAGERPDTLKAFCAYHQQTASAPMLFYSYDPYVVGNPGCDDGNHPNGPSDGALDGGLSHEHNESITDPIPNDAWTNGAGPNQGLEVGDQCGSVMGDALGTHNGAKYNQVIDGHFYWYQTEWSNIGHTCLQRLNLTDRMPTATFTATPGSGTTMTFDATGSSAPGGVFEFSWQFNDAFAAQTQATAAPTIAHTFPESGTYSIGLAVMSPSGFSAGAGGLITTGHRGFTPGFTTSTSGQTVSFSALPRISRKPVSNVMWEFGDGTSGSGLTPSHTYAAPGTYTVKAILFSGIGSAFPGDGAAPLAVKQVTVG
ncbi:MAG: hypothetical protein QOG59_2744 [Solirubrobacteraceae bacterium]|nr:hypothetical protein [Solirubrobacteraceae bacterium]